jgi:O-antigen/teichoic acid export membrane protein
MARDPIAFESLRTALAGNLVGRIVQIVALLLSAIVLARLLGPAGLGVVAIATAMVRLAGIPVEEGAAKLCEREIAGAIGKGDSAQASAALRFGLIATVVLGVTGAAAVWAFAPVDRSSATGQGVLPAALGLLCVSIVTASLRGLLRGEGQTTWAIKVTNAQSLLAPAFYLAWVAMGQEITPAAALWLQAASKLALVPGLALLVRRHWHIAGRGETREAMAIPRGWITESAQFTLLGVVSVALAEVGTIMLGYLSTPEEAGIFRIASRAFLLAGFVTVAMQQAYGPRIAKDWQAGNADALELPSRMMSVAALAGGLVSLIVFALIGKPVLSGAFGPEFEAAYWPALIMVGGAISAGFGAVSPRLLKMTGEQRIVFRAALLGLAVAGGLNLVLIPHFGAMGCAVASVAAITLGRIFMNRGVTRHLGFSATPDRDSARELWRRMPIGQKRAS